MDMKLEVVVLPVSDPDRAKEFYKALGWREDGDFVAEDQRVVQLTPPGSPCSVQFGTGRTADTPGSLRGLYLVVDDIEAARAELAERGARVSEIFHEAVPGARFQAVGGPGRTPGPADGRSSYGSFLSFDDPDGNGWVVQEITNRLRGRARRRPWLFTRTFWWASATVRAMRPARVSGRRAEAIQRRMLRRADGGRPGSAPRRAGARATPR